jgi:hypothetical protein
VLWLNNSTTQRLILTDDSVATLEVPLFEDTSARTVNTIPFFNSSGRFSTDTDFIWDGTNSRLGICVSDPEYKLEVAGQAYLSGTSAGLLFDDVSSAPISVGTNEGLLWVINSAVSSIMYTDDADDDFTVETIRVESITGTHTAEFGVCYRVLDSTAASFDLTLPSCSSTTIGRQVEVVNEDGTYTCTVKTAASEYFHDGTPGSTSVAVGPGGTVQLRCIGADPPQYRTPRDEPSRLSEDPYPGASRVTPRMHRAALALGLLVLLPLTYALADSEHYKVISSAPSTYRSTGLSSDDSLDWTSPLDTSTTVIRVEGNPNLWINGSFSTVGATVTVRTGLYHEASGTWTFLGIADVSTLTASSRELFDGTEYVSESPIFVDTSGAKYVELRVLDVSGGTVELKPILFGSATK